MVYWYSLTIIFLVNLIITASVFVVMFVRTIEYCLPSGFVITSHSPVCLFCFCSWLLFSFTFVSSRLPRVLSSFFSSVWQSSPPSDSAFVLLSTVCYGFWSQLTVCHGFCSPSHWLSWLLFSFSMIVISFFIALFYLYCTSHSFCSSSHKLPWLLCSSIPHYLFFA